MTGAGPEDPDRGDEQPLDFDPYRFGKPDHPIPPEYAPPGYVPPPPVYPQQPVWPPTNDPSPGYSGQPGYPIQSGYPGQGPPGPGYPGQGYPGQQNYPGYPGHPMQQGHNPYPYPPPPPGYPYGMPRQTNTKATVALVLGILAVVFCWLSIFDLVLIVPAIVFGALGRRDAARFPDQRGKGAATTGLICGIVAVALALAATVFVYARVKDCVDNYDRNSSAYTHCVNHRLFGATGD